MTKELKVLPPSEKFCESCLITLTDTYRLCDDCRTTEMIVNNQKHIAWCYRFMAEDPSMNEGDLIRVYIEIDKCQRFVSGLMETA